MRRSRSPRTWRRRLSHAWSGSWASTTRACRSGRGRLSFRLASAVDFGQPLKQRLLESRSETERLDLLIAVMKALIPGLELRKQREQAIRGNGKGY